MVLKRGMLHSKSYATWKAETQGTFDFSVLVCHAVPTLKRNLVLFEKGVVTDLVRADHYGSADPLTKEAQNRVKESLRSKADGYKAKLSRYILISNFSFFEAYVVDVVQEVLDFHGGRTAFEKGVTDRSKKQLLNPDVQREALMRRLRVNPQPSRTERYRNASRELLKIGYRFPSELLAGFGMRALFQRIDSLKSHEIPDLMQDVFLLQLTEQERSDFHATRDVRNKIAHGDRTELSIREVTERCQKLRDLAMKFDGHLVEHFFISERFLPLS